jgi:hypothetical protein
MLGNIIGKIIENMWKFSWNMAGTPKFKRIPSPPALPSALKGKKMGPLGCMLNSPIGCMNMAILGLVPMAFWVFF